MTIKTELASLGIDYFGPFFLKILTSTNLNSLLCTLQRQENIFMIRANFLSFKALYFQAQ